MRIRRSLQATALTAAAVVLGLATVQGTYALWSATASAAPGTVSSAAFTMDMTAVPSGQATAMTLANGQSANLAVTPTAALTPGSSVYGGVVVANNTNAGGTFNTTVTVTKGTVTSTGDGSLAQNVTINAKSGSLPADCDASSGYETLTAAGLTSPSVAKTASTVLCFQVTLNAAPPPSAKGQAVTIPITLTARQVCGVPGDC
jgi:hypothetical protein